MAEQGRRWDGKERREGVYLTEAQIDAIAERAADKAIERVYTEVGRQVVKRSLLVVGAGIIALTVWLQKIGKIALW